MSDVVARDWILGIDLGTTNSAAAMIVFPGENGEKPELLPNDEGARVSPSYVSCDESPPLVGQAAKDKLVSAPELTMHDSKRLIGRQWLDPHVQRHLTANVFGCKVVDDGGGQPAFEIPIDGVPTLFSPTQIAAFLLEKFKELAEKRFHHPGQRIVATVIGVPAHFNEVQRKATLEAARQVGLPNAHLIAEPSAAAFAYGLNSGRLNGYNVLVYDFGGGTFDVSVLEVKNGDFEVLAKNGDDELGGRDIDIYLRDYLVQRIRDLISERMTGRDGVLSEQGARLLRKCDNPKIQHRLLKEAEAMKMALSRQEHCSLYLPAHGFDEIDESIDITRGDFEAIEGVHDSLYRTIEIVRTTLQAARLRPSEVDVVILVGGSSRIPRVRQMLADEFSIDGSTRNSRIKDSLPSPDESVAYGAALYGLQLMRETERQRPNTAQPRLFETTALGISVGIRYDRCQIVLERGERIPVRRTQRFKTTSNDQPSILIELFEGASLFTAKCNRFASLEHRNLPPGAAGSVYVDVTLWLDANGILHVSASLGQDRYGSEQCTRLDVDYADQQSRRSQRRVHEMLTEAHAEREAEKAEFDRLSMLAELEERISAVRYQLDRLGAAPTQAQRDAREKCVLAEGWLRQHKATANTEQLSDKCAELGEPI